jgi:hypothetical protein
MAKWLLVDEGRLELGLERALVTFTGPVQELPALESRLGSLGVVTRIAITRSRRDVVCEILYRRQERDEVYAALEGTGLPMIWDELISLDRGIERTAWLGLARRLASEEGLLAGGGAESL